MNKTHETINLSEEEKMEFLKGIAVSLCAQYGKRYCLLLMLDKMNNSIYPVYNLSPEMMIEAANTILVNDLPPAFMDDFGTGDKLCEITKCSHYFILLISEYVSIYGEQMFCNTNCSTEDWQKLMQKVIGYTRNAQNRPTIH